MNEREYKGARLPAVCRGGVRCEKGYWVKVDAALRTALAIQPKKEKQGRGFERRERGGEMLGGIAKPSHHWRPEAL